MKAPLLLRTDYEFQVAEHGLPYADESITLLLITSGGALRQSRDVDAKREMVRHHRTSVAAAHNRPGCSCVDRLVALVNGEAVIITDVDGLERALAT